MTTDIEKIEAELFELNKIRFIRPTAMQLRQRRHSLVNRVQRQEDRRHKRTVEKRKIALTKTLADLKSTKFSTPTTLTLNQKVPKRVQTRIESKKRLKQLR